MKVSGKITAIYSKIPFQKDVIQIITYRKKEYFEQ